jgi:putative phosphoesterase
MQTYQSATIISDVHGVSPALRAVLEEEASNPSEVLVVLGDSLAGPLPNETCELLQRHANRMVAILGNADREIMAVHNGTERYTYQGVFQHAADSLNQSSLDWLESLPDFESLELSGIGEVLICHATPQNDEDIVVVDSAIERWNQVFDGLADQVKLVLLGHTHMPFQRLVNRRRVINPGSVGLPYGGSGAHWVRISDGVIETRVTHFDIPGAIAEIVERSGFADARTWATEMLNSTSSDVDALNRMNPRPT